MLNKLRDEWKTLIQDKLEEMAGGEKLPEVVVQVPPKPDMGDLAFPLFAYAKAFHKAPAIIAKELKESIENDSKKVAGEMILAGPYLNVRLDIVSLTSDVHEMAFSSNSYGFNESLKDKKVMVEFSCPNTNKPLHLGHVRNDSIGQSVSSILKANGAEVKKVNLINNRGVHICKSMLAYSKFGNGETPESSGIKGDHLVGNYYVKFAQWAKEEPKADQMAQDMLLKWESGDEETVALWEKMNSWTLDGLAESYKNMGINFDKYYYESNTYKLGKDRILDGLDRGIFQKADDGAVFIDLSDIKLDKKILLRKDGTSLYITQDIGTAIARHEDWPFDSLIYVVGSEQKYHFQVLFHVLKKLGYKWAEDLHHLSYGMVFLPDGKMKSREGTVVDADELVVQLTTLAKNEILSKGREDELEDADKTAHDIALGALNYYLLQFDPNKDIVFNPSESISFNGNTGPYLQYMGARICSMLRKFDDVKERYNNIKFNPELLCLEEEKQMIKMIAEFPSIVEKAGENYDPSLICSSLYELSKIFSHWYHDNPVLKADSDGLVKARVDLCIMILNVFKTSFSLIGIPFLEKM